MDDIIDKLNDLKLNKRSQICLNNECNKQPSYGLEDGKPIYCKTHAGKDMIDVKHKKCLKCNKRPYYGLEDGKPIYCKAHAEKDMIDIKNKRCLKCNKQPAYGLEDGNPIYCKTHAEKDMFDVKNKKCLKCDKQPAYGLENGKPIYCKTHAKKDMIDVISKRCLKCYKIPCYGLETGKAIYCKTHAEKDMFDVKNKKCLKCYKIPCYGLEDGKPIYCKTHAEKDMIDVISKRCITCNLVQVKNKYKLNCSGCHFYLNPNDPRIRNYKTKEHAFMLPIQKEFPNIVLDKVIAGGCSKRRPDGLLDCLTHSIIIEIDENQHVGYDNLCNNRRNMELYTDLGNRPIIFIRLNPDSYKIDGKRMKGVFSVTKSTGELKQNMKEFNKRYDVLLNEIKKRISDIPNKSIDSIDLFYD